MILRPRPNVSGYGGIAHQRKTLGYVSGHEDGWLVCSIGIGIAFRLIGVNDSCSAVVEVVGKVQAGGLA